MILKLKYSFAKYHSLFIMESIMIVHCECGVVVDRPSKILKKKKKKKMNYNNIQREPMKK